MGNINSNVKRLIRYNNIQYKEFAKRIGLGVGTVRSAFSRDRDEVWMRAFEYGYELGRFAGQNWDGARRTYINIKKQRSGAFEKTTWQERLSELKKSAQKGKDEFADPDDVGEIDIPADGKTWQERMRAQNWED